MKHLSDEALVDLAEGGTAGLEHLDACLACRDRVQSMRHMMRVLQEDPVPEPSPLFWEHLADRIRRAAVGEATSGAADWRTVPRWGWGLAAVAAVVMAVLVMRPVRSPDTVAERSLANSSSQAGEGGVAAAGELSWAAAAADASWQIVEGAAADLDVEATVDAGIFLREGSLDRELLMLSDRDRRDLARTIQTELDRSRS